MIITRANAQNFAYKPNSHNFDYLLALGYRTHTNKADYLTYQELFVPNYYPELGIYGEGLEIYGGISSLPPYPHDNIQTKLFSTRRNPQRNNNA